MFSRLRVLELNCDVGTRVVSVPAMRLRWQEHAGKKRTRQAKRAGALTCTDGPKPACARARARPLTI